MYCKNLMGRVKNMNNVKNKWNDTKLYLKTELRVNRKWEVTILWGSILLGNTFSDL